MPENNVGRREFIKLGALGALIAVEGFCPLAGRLFAAEMGKDKKERNVKYDIVKGNKCGRCLKELDTILEDEEMKEELDALFPDGKTVTFAFGSRARVKSAKRTIAIGNCARNMKSPLHIKGCAPKARHIVDELKKAFENYNNNKTYKKKYKYIFGK